MHKILLPLLGSVLFLAACISVSVEMDETRQPVFVTATLIPTKAGFVPPTLTPKTRITSEPVSSATLPSSCKDSAVLLRDVTVPDGTRMQAGENFTKTWEFRNTGTCPWVNYLLKFAAGDDMGAPLSAPIQDTSPGNSVLVGVNLTAPLSDGGYTAYFTLNEPSGRDVPIGTEKTFWVKIVVGEILPQATTSGSLSTPYVPKGGNSNCAYTSNGGYVQQLIASINQARADAQLPALTINEQLTAAAQGHSADMACNNFLGHTGSDGSYIGNRILKAGYTPAGYMEIIAIGTPQDAMRQWRADQPHWDVVLNPGLAEFGVGYAYYASSDFGGYFTVDLGTR
ncbi:MAG: hypothetical protein FJZ87_04050 [Chloroflexi bacterium]|nr:hypothetical protein [Chloroflexota bacterium]